MPDVERESRGRLEGIRFQDLTPEQLGMWNSIVGGARGASGSVVHDKKLGGPFDAWLRAPAVGERAAALGESLRFGGSLDPMLREVVILTVGSWWRSNYEFWSHERIAIGLGVEQGFVEQIAAGAVSGTDDSDSMVLVHHLSQCLLEHGHLSEGDYFDAVKVIGVEGLVELVLLIGYYTAVSMTLSVFKVSPPSGEPVRW